MRNEVFCMENRKTPQNLRIQDVTNGKCEIPEKLFHFISSFIRGPNYRRRNSEEDIVRIKSICFDMIFDLTKGRVKPSKHLMLESALKSLPSSRKVLTILNKYGHK